MRLSVFFAYIRFSNGSILYDSSIGPLEDTQPPSLFLLDLAVLIGIIGITLFALIAVVFHRRLVAKSTIFSLSSMSFEISNSVINIIKVNQIYLF
jgi:hypothetical protein